MNARMISLCVGLLAAMTANGAPVETLHPRAGPCSLLAYYVDTLALYRWQGLTYQGHLEAVALAYPQDAGAVMAQMIEEGEWPADASVVSTDEPGGLTPEQRISVAMHMVENRRMARQLLVLGEWVYEQGAEETPDLIAERYFAMCMDAP